MTKKVFISLTKKDSGLADAMSNAINELFGGHVATYYSTKKELEGGIRGGENWFQWIVEQVRQCDLAFILVTPNSVQKPWIMWESGAVYGAALADGTTQVTKVRPVIFQLRSSELPSPIRDANAQYRYGDRPADIKQLFDELFDQFRGEFTASIMTDYGRKFGEVTDKYLSEVRSQLKNAAALPSHNVVEEWRHRLDDLASQDRISEIEQLHRWMDVTFGLEDGDPQPIDMRIHARLGTIYMKGSDYRNAIAQLTLAQRLAPRDIYILRTLARAHLEDKNRDAAWEIIGRIEELDETAFSHNAECAALKGRYYREAGDNSSAAEIYDQASAHNPESYYLANLAAEAYAAIGNGQKSKEKFQLVLAIIKQLNEVNVWTVASKANAYIALGDLDAAMGELDLFKSKGGQLSADQRDIVSDGFRRIAGYFDIEDSVSPLIQAVDEF